MGGFFGVASKEDCVFDLFFGTDYHSHLGTRRAGMAVYSEEHGFEKAIHKINSVFVFIVDNISYSNWGTNNTASAGTVPMAFSLEISTYPCSEGSK